MFAFVGSLSIAMVRAAVRTAVRTAVRAAVRFSWPNGCNEQRPTQTRLWSAKKATLMTQVRFEVRFEGRFEVRVLILTPLIQCPVWSSGTDGSSLLFCIPDVTRVLLGLLGLTGCLAALLL